MRKTLMLLLCAVLILGGLGLPVVAHAALCPMGGRHLWATETYPATCTEAGLTTQTCTRCGEVNSWILDAQGHDWDEWLLYPEPTCEKDGTITRVCKRDPSHVETEVFPAYEGGHDWSNETFPAGCETTGLTIATCQKCGEKNTWILDPLGHDYGEWLNSFTPTCEYEGTEIRFCTRDIMHPREERTVPALGHDWGNWIEVTPATATEAGMEQRVCKRRAKHVEQREIPAEGVWGPWIEDFAPTCDADGQETRQHSTDPSKKEIRSIPALGHDYGKWLNSTTPTCEFEGVEIRFCSRDIKHPREERVVPALGHDWECTVTKAPTCTEKGEESCVCRRNATHVSIGLIPETGHVPQWVQTKAPTTTEEGERQLICQVCGTVLQVETIPMLTRVDYYNNTTCALGLHFRDVAPSSTKEWFMFTPLDLSQEGEQSYPLIASNAYVVGTMKVAVEGGQVTVSYELINGAKASSEYLTFYPDLDTALAQEPAKLGGKNFAIGQPISIADDLEGDTSVLLFLLNRVSFHSELRELTRFFPRNPEHAKLVEGMKELIAAELP